MKRILIQIGKGKAVVKTDGYLGAECEAASWGIEKRLGKATNTMHTDEYYQGEQTPTPEIENR